MQQRERRLCPNPNHKERTPSFIIYGDGGHCFGCGFHINSTDIEDQVPEEPRYVENVEERLEYITSLPKRLIRGLNLHCDGVFYYLVWPDRSYYKARRSESEGNGNKYRNPVGVKAPLYVDNISGKYERLIIVEGELNAASLVEAGVRDVCSPGSATDMYSSKYNQFLAFYKKYRQYLIIADNDKAGTLAGIELKARLLQLSPFVRLTLWEKDANDILQEANGKEKLKERVGDLEL